MKVTIKEAADHNLIMVGRCEAKLKSNNCRFKFPIDVTAEEILETIQEALRQYEFQKVDGLPLNLEVTRKMHQVIRESTLIQRIRYIQLVGPRDEIMRQEQFQDAVDFLRFNKFLSNIGIENHFTSESVSKRIIAVHPQYVEYDEEIREGLKVMHYKHRDDNPVFVESEETLKYALANCAKGSTLVIDGHWVHNKKVRHGVWEPCTAAELAAKIAAVVNAVPGKISHVNLLGCESGAINDALEGTVAANRLFFKYDQKPALADRYMGSQRNRAIYVSAEKESVFNPDSLAFQLLSKLSDPSIAVTATPKLLYPWPPEDPIINIGSDSENWKDEVQAYAPSTNKDDLCTLLGQVKSVTQVDISEVESNPKRPWSFRIC